MKTGIFIAAVLACVAACSGGRGQQTEALQPEQPTGLIQGVVVNEKGQPVDGARVWAWRLDAASGKGVRFVDSGPRGQFVEDRLDWGEYMVCAEKEADGYPHLCANFYEDGRMFKATLSPKAPVADVVVVVGPKAGVLSGSVRDATTGALIPDAGLVLMRPASKMPYIYSGTLLPKFRVLMPPDSDLDFKVAAPGYQTWQYSVNGGSQGSLFRMSSDERRSMDIYLWPDAAAAKDK